MPLVVYNMARSQCVAYLLITVAATFFTSLNVMCKILRIMGERPFSMCPIFLCIMGLLQELN